MTEKTDLIEDKEVIKNNKSQNSKIILVIILISAIILFFVSLGAYNRLKLNNDNLASESTNLLEEEIIGNLYRNNQYKFRIKFPESWEIENGDGPHIIKKATKDGSTVFVLARAFFEEKEGQLLLDEMKQEYKKETGINLSDSEAKQVIAELTADDFSDKEFEEMMSSALPGILSKYEGAQILNEEIRYLDNKKAFYVKFEAPYRALGLEVQVIMVQYITLYNGNIYEIGGGSSKDDFSIVEKQINLSISSFVFENF